MLNRIRKNLINISGIYILLISRLYCALSQTILLLLLRFKTRGATRLPVIFYFLLLYSSQGPALIEELPRIEL